MTCIAGIETKDSVIIGCDSAAANGWDIHATSLKKVFKRNKFLIGYTTSFRMGQLLQYSLFVDKQGKKQDDLEYLATTFIDAVRDCLGRGGFKRIEDSRESGGQFLVGYRGRLYSIGSDFQVNRSLNGYMAVGCGACFALGSLWSNWKWLTPRHRIRQALRAAGHFSNGVCGPYHIRELKL